MNKFLFAILGMLISTSCNGTKSTNSSSDDIRNESKEMSQPSIVVFFSHAGENYAVGNIKTGNTKIVADYISEMTGAEQFEIATDKYDGMSYDALCELAKNEQQKGELPAYKGEIEDISKYNTIFIGGPVWWGTYPQVMFTFFKKHDLNGKRIIPFTTHEGSGLGNCVNDIKKTYPKADVQEGLSIYGHKVNNSKEDVRKWLKKFGY